MTAYQMQGTPTLILVDRAGYRRMQRFGHVDDLTLRSAIGTLFAEPPSMKGADPEAGCSDVGCAVPNAA